MQTQTIFDKIRAAIKRRRPVKGQAVFFARIAEPSIAGYLDGRLRDSRVKYYAAMNRSRRYPYASKRQNQRYAALGAVAA